MRNINYINILAVHQFSAHRNQNNCRYELLIEIVLVMTLSQKLINKGTCIKTNIQDFDVSL